MAEIPQRPAEGAQLSLEQLAQQLQLLNQRVTELSQQNQHLVEEVNTLRTESPANVDDETKLGALR